MIKVKNICRFVLLGSMILLLSACGREGGCNPASKIAEYDTSDCSLCSVFRVVFNAVSDIAAIANNNFNNPVILLVLVGFAVWLATFILKYLATMETRDIKDVFQEVLIKGFQVVLVIAALHYGASNFYKWLINPVYETILSAADKAAQISSNMPSSVGIKVVSNKGSVDNVPNGLPSSMGDSIIKTMTSIENNVLQIRAFGSSLTCYSWEKRRLGIIPNFSLMMSGGFFWLLAMAMIVILPFLMIDAVFQLGVAVALLAPAIGGYPFRATRIYSKKVWDIFLNSAFTFLFVSIVTLMLISVLQQTAEDITKDTGLTWADIMSDDKGKVDEYVDKFGWFHNNMLKFAMVFLLAWTVMSMGRKFADEFASSIVGTSIGGSIGTMGMSAAKGLAKKVGQPAGQLIGDKVEKGAASFGQRIGHFHQRRVENRQQRRFNRGFDRHRGTNSVDENGNLVASYTRNRKFLGMGFGGLFGKVTISRDADGNITKEKQAGPVGRLFQKAGNIFKRKGSGGTVVKNVVTTTRSERMSNDNYVTERKVKVTKGQKVFNSGTENEYSENFVEERVVSEIVLPKTRDAENILNEKGELDHEKVDKMMTGLNDKQKVELQRQIAHKLQMDMFGDFDKKRARNIVTEVEGDVVRTIVTLPGGRKEITEVRFPHGNKLTMLNDRKEVAKATGAEKVYNAEDLQKYMDAQQNALSDVSQSANFANIHELAKEDLQDFVNGKLAITPDAHEKMAKFIDTFTGGYKNEEMQKLHDDAMKKLDDVVESRTNHGPEQVVMSRVIVRKNGRVTKLTTDGIYNRIDNFRIFNEDDNGLVRGLKRMARGIPGYHIYDNVNRRREISQMNSIADVEARAVRYDDGRIKMQTLLQEGLYYSGIEEPEAVSMVLPEDQSLNRFFHFTGAVTDKEHGVWAAMNQNGEFVDRYSGQVLAKKKVEIDEEGKSYQVYLTALGDEYTIRTNSEGKNVKVTRNQDGTLEWGKEIIGKPERELVIKYGADGSEERMMLKNGMLSDVNGIRVYGTFEKSKMAHTSEERAYFANYFK